MDKTERDNNLIKALMEKGRLTFESLCYSTPYYFVPNDMKGYYKEGKASHFYSDLDEIYIRLTGCDDMLFDRYEIESMYPKNAGRYDGGDICYRQWLKDNKYYDLLIKAHKFKFGF